MEGKILFALLLVTIGATLTMAIDGYQSKCTITEGAGIKVDSCDAVKFLSCQSNRCMCNDIGNQLYDYRLEPEKTYSRSKRGLKKKVAIGVGAGAVGYVAGRAASKGSSGSGSSRDKYTKVFSCYGRVGSPCVLDYNNVVNVVPLSTTTTTTTSTTPNPTTTTTDGTLVLNGTDLANFTTTTTTTTTQAPVPALVVYDINKIPKCVRNAICTRQSSSFSTIISKAEVDPRIGICTCAEGYKASNTDKCEKSGSAQLISSVPALFLVVYTAFISKYIG